MDRFTKAREAARGGPKVLLATSVGGHHPVALFDSLLAVALTMAGAEVHFLLCDGALGACEHLTFQNTPDLDGFARCGVEPGVCDRCFGLCNESYSTLGLLVHRYSNWLRDEDRALARHLAEGTPFQDMAGLVLNGQRVGEHAQAGALRFFARGELEPGALSEAVLRRYLEGAAATSLAVNNLLRGNSFQRACFHHGIYVPQGLVGEACRANGVGVANWQVAYRKRSFIFSHGDTYHHTMIDEPVRVWQGMGYGPELRQKTRDYLASRITGANDWIWFHERVQGDQAEVLRELGLDPA
ncbi:MAG: hypothetical protein Q8S17_02395, partial [Humidesulfovibrio sp.]|nr:hypothetical protein [Humidesulfovibrio sp.]